MAVLTRAPGAEPPRQLRLEAGYGAAVAAAYLETRFLAGRSDEK